MKNKNAIYLIIILLLAVIVIGSTYAYFTAIVKGPGNELKANSSDFQIIYNGDESVDGTIGIVSDKSESGSHSSTIQIGLDSNSNINGVTADILFNVTTISDNLKIKGFKWEAYTVDSGVETIKSSGNFSNATNNSVIKLVEDYPLTTTLTTFKIYIWIDGNDSSTTNAVADGTARFSGYISAKSNKVTGKIN